MEPEFYGELFKGGLLLKRYYWRLRNSNNHYEVASCRGGKGSGYSTKEEAARMFDRVFQSMYILKGVLDD